MIFRPLSYPLTSLLSLTFFVHIRIVLSQHSINVDIIFLYGSWDVYHIFDFLKYNLEISQLPRKGSNDFFSVQKPGVFFCHASDIKAVVTIFLC